MLSVACSGDGDDGRVCQGTSSPWRVGTARVALEHLALLFLRRENWGSARTREVEAGRIVGARLLVVVGQRDDDGGYGEVQRCHVVQRVVVMIV